jgi:hypothetical protein
MSKLTPKQQAELTIKALEERKKKKLKAGKEADKFRYGRALENINKKNKRCY